MIPTTKVNLCANLLYYWLQSKNYQADEGILLDTDAFQVWTSEFFGDSVTQDEILQAILTLRKEKLVRCQNHKIFLLNQFHSQAIKMNKLPVYDLIELKQYRRDNNVFRWVLIFIVSLLTLWGGCFWLSLRITQLSSSNLVIPNSHYDSLLD